MIRIDTRAAMKDLARGLDRLQRRQLPFAAAQALTAVARKVAAAESAGLAETFDRPTPFTRRAFAVIGARKASLTATVFARDIQAAYLAPYIAGGAQALGRKRAILTPVEIALNQYGNIPRGKLAALKGRPGLFVGEVKLKDGRRIGGVWQRPDAPRLPRHKGHVQARTKLKLLVEFTAPKAVSKRLPYGARAARVVAAELPAAWDTALRQALATAR